MISRDKTCAAEGCTIPAAWCHAHHRVPWSRGGRTSVADGPMVCPRHHPDHTIRRQEAAAQRVPRTCDVIAVDLPGHGASSGSRDHSLGSLAAAGRFTRPLAGRLWNDLPCMLRQMATLDDPVARRSFMATTRPRS